MNLFRKHNKEMKYRLWHDWYVILDDKYEFIDNGDSGQLVNRDGDRVIYGSSFVLAGVDNVKDDLQYIDMKKDKEGGSTSLSASISQNNEFLTITVTYINTSDENWARSVIESARHV